MRKLHFSLLLPLAILLFSCQPQPENRSYFEVSFEVDSLNQALDGRLLLLLSNNKQAEPRFQIGDGPTTQLVFGIDVEGWKKGEKQAFDGSVFGYPLESLKDLPAGKYYVQALLHRYETFNLSTGHTVKLPMDNGEGQQWNTSPGNLYSTPVEIQFDPQKSVAISLKMDQAIPPIVPPEDSKYIRHIRMKSELLSEFWGRPMYLGAHILLPEGFDEHPEAKYPLAVFHGHFPADFGGWRTTPPDPNLVPDSSARFSLKGYNIIQQQEFYDFYKLWTGPDFPRFLAIEIQHPTPYYDDSYAVNSASQGPWGDALTYELIPFIEKQFRGLGEGWARFLYGGSTGGWEALAVQVFYPDEYNGCFAACPDPIDFSAYTTIDIYKDKNAYFLESDFKKTERPMHRDYLGHVSSTAKDANHLELVLGTHSRSGQQFDIWEATYSPQGKDGYPRRLWDKYSGEIDHEVAAYWRENYDLNHIMKRDWATLGPKLRGKIHIYCGDMDNYYLNNAVYKTEDFLKSTNNPPYEGEVDYGDRAEHCWNGDHSQPNAISRLRYHRMFIPRSAERLLKSAPPGADVASWRY